MTKKNSKVAWIEDELDNLKSQGLYKNIKTIGSSVGAEFIVDGKKVLNFCSNNYLGFADNESLKSAAKRGIDKYGVGTAAVRVISGTLDLHLKLEKELADFKCADQSILFQSGFIANLATIQALVGEGDLIFSDELNHASIIDGCRLSRAEVIRYKHGDVDDLISLLEKNKNKTCKKLIITDGVFSMDGDIAPLDKLSKVAEKYEVLLMVDDAHGEGVLGKAGRGIVDHFNLHGKVDIEIGTMSKALGVVGGFASGRKIIIDWLRQKARPFLFSNATTPADTAACLAAIKLLKTKGDKLVGKLWDNANYLRDGFKKAGFDTGSSETPIIPVMVGDEKLAKEYSLKLFGEGLYVVPITYPMVAMGKARIRVMPSAAHNRKHLDKALEAFIKVGRELKII